MMIRRFCFCLALSLLAPLLSSAMPSWAEQVETLTIMGGTKIAEITSEAFGGTDLDETQPEDPANAALFFEGLKIHVLKNRYRPQLEKMLEHLRQALKEPGQLE